MCFPSQPLPSVTSALPLSLPTFIFLLFSSSRRLKSSTPLPQKNPVIAIHPAQRCHGNNLALQPRCG